MNELLSKLAPYLWLIGIPLLFLLLVLYVFRPGAKRKYRNKAQIPFEEDEDKPH